MKSQKSSKAELDIGIRINVENADIKNNAFEIMSGIPTKFGIRLEQLYKGHRNMLNLYG